MSPHTFYGEFVLIPDSNEVYVTAREAYRGENPNELSWQLEWMATPEALIELGVATEAMLAPRSKSGPRPKAVDADDDSYSRNFWFTHRADGSFQRKCKLFRWKDTEKALALPGGALAISFAKERERKQAAWDAENKAKAERSREVYNALQECRRRDLDPGIRAAAQPLLPPLPPLREGTVIDASARFRKAAAEFPQLSPKAASQVEAFMQKYRALPQVSQDQLLRVLDALESGARPGEEAK